MSFDIEAAKQAGYSDKEIQSFLGENRDAPKFDIEAAKSAGYSDKEIDSFIKDKEISKTRSVVSAPIKGLIKGAEEYSSLANPSQMILNQLGAGNDSILGKLTERVLPTKDEATEGVLERGGKILPAALLGGGGVVRSLIQSGGGAFLGELAKEEGIGEGGQALAEIAGMSLPGIIKEGAKKAASLIKAPIEKLSSGLTKPRALDAKGASKAIMSPERQAKALADLDKEAAKLADTSVYKQLPLADQIKSGVDFGEQFNKRFGALEKIAEKSKADIDITPLSKFLSETGKKYKGIPKLHPEGSKVVQEIRAFQSNPQIDRAKLLRTYRSNNKKISGIYETSRMSGKQQEYVDFLLDYNRKIADSFEKTFPDSKWVKEFRDTNKLYKEYRDTQKTMQLIDPSLGQKATPLSLQRFADNPKMQKKLELSMGKKGADEIIQISKDLKLASDSIKKIPAKEVKLWEAIFPLSVFIPGAQIPGGVAAAKKSLDWARRGYGWFLSTPARRSSYNEALKSIAEGSRPAYIKATQELQKSLKEQSSED